jgi:hypothetical protein
LSHSAVSPSRNPWPSFILWYHWYTLK